MARVGTDSLHEGAVTTDGPARGERAWLVPETMVARYAGPALHIDADGTLRATNASGRILMVAAAERLRDHVIRTLIGHVPWITRVEIELGEQRRVFDLTLLPLAGEPSDGVLILGREATLEHNLTRALAASRALYKDLVTCSADFAWETDAEGRFTFISPGGALGHAADALVGESFTLLTGELAESAGDSPFLCRTPVSEHELRLDGGNGEVACVRVSSLPVGDGANGWRGARGVCRDVTVERIQQAALRRAEQREALMRAVVDAIRTEATPEAMFRTAAGSTADALGAENCWVLRGAEVTEVVARHGDDATPPPSGLESSSPAADDPRPFAVDPGRPQTIALAAHCAYRGKRLGHLAVSRATARGPWTEEEESFLAGVAAQLGIAMAQATIQDKLRALSTTDELTGLANRRGFLDELQARLDGDRRARGTLLYLDLDNFKPVNDTHGHARGDEVLVALASILEGAVRAGDLVARLGGDEFIVWLDGADEPGGLVKAQRLVAAAAGLRDFSADDERPLSLSIGVAVTDADARVSVEALIEQADRQMYLAKQGGKNRVALVGPAR